MIHAHELNTTLNINDICNAYMVPRSVHSTEEMIYDALSRFESDDRYTVLWSMHHIYIYIDAPPNPVLDTYIAITLNGSKLMPR